MDRRADKAIGLAFRSSSLVTAASSMKLLKTYRVRAIKAPLKLIWTTPATFRHVVGTIGLRAVG
jgi:hypothetical protein